MSKTVLYASENFARQDFETDMEKSQIEASNLTKFGIKKNTVVANHQVLTLETETGRRSTSSYTLETGALPHKDLKDVMKRAACHLAILTEYEKLKRTQNISFLNNAKDIPVDFEKYTATSISISGHDSESYGVVISGQRKLENGGLTNLNSVLVKLEQESYLYVSELNVLMDDLYDEVMLFLAGKQGTPSQTQMKFEEAA